MRISRAIGWVLVLCMALSVGLVAPDLAEAEPKVTAHYYNGDTMIKYYSIAGNKYRNANALMKAYAKKAYAENQDALSTYAEDRQDDPEVTADAYYFRITPQVKYSRGAKMSILYTEEFLLNGPHPNTSYTSFNLHEGKMITLSKAFKSQSKFSSANAKAREYWRLNWSQQGLYEMPDSSQTGLSGHEYYWTPKGLTVIYEAYVLGSYADGERRYSVPKSYLKY